MNLNNIKIGTKIGAGAMLLVLITVILGLVAYNALNGVSISIDELLNNDAKSVEYSVGVERAAYDTMTQEKNYFIYLTDVYSTGTRDNSKAIYTALDKLDELAKKYNNDALLTKSKDARDQTTAFQAKFDEVVVIMDTKKALETKMATQGAVLSDTYNKYITGLNQDMATAVSSKNSGDINAISSQLVTANKGLEAVGAVRINNLKYWRAPSADTKKAVETNLQDLLNILNQMDAATSNAENKAMIAQTKAGVTEYQKSVEDWAATEDKRALAFPILKASIEGVIAKGVAAEQEGFAQLKEGGDITTSSAQSAMSLVIAALAVAFVVGIAVALILAKIITRPINKIRDEARNLAATGNLTIRASVLGTDEIGEMAVALNDMLDNTAAPIKELSVIAEDVAKGDLTKSVNIKAKGDVQKLIDSFKEMVDGLRDTIEQINKSADTMASSSQELSASAEEVNASNEEVTSTVQQMAKGAQDQSKALEDASRSVEKVAGNAKAVVSASGQAAEAAKSAGTSAAKGQELGNQATGKMKELADAMSRTSKDVKSLDEKGQKIGDIVNAITKIADQTNLLALNAAIEAARAGDAGRGFAVVADEVRKLAEEASSAAGQIEGIIKDMIDSTKGTSQSMNEGVKTLDETNKVVNNALKELVTISEIATEVQRKAQEVTLQANEASTGTVSVAEVVRTLSATAQENSAAAEEVSASTEETAASMNQVSQAAQRLAELSMELNSIVSRFKLSDKATEKPQVASKVADAKKAEPVAKKNAAENKKSVEVKKK